MQDLSFKRVEIMSLSEVQGSFPASSAHPVVRIDISPHSFQSTGWITAYFWKSVAIEVVRQDSPQSILHLSCQLHHSRLNACFEQVAVIAEISSPRWLDGPPALRADYGVKLFPSYNTS